MEGLTGIREKAIGFVGRAPLRDTTRKGRQRIRFDIYCGESKPELNKYSTLRHCVAYGDAAGKLINLKKGERVHVNGWIQTENPEFSFDLPLIESPELRETLICFSAEILPSRLDDNKESQLPLGVGQASE